jgi:uncharacterized protein YkwD
MWDTLLRSISTRPGAPRTNSSAAAAFRGWLAQVKFNEFPPLALLAALIAGCAHVTPPAADVAAGPMARQISLANFDYGLLGAAIFEETNRVRVSNGLHALALHPALDAAAAEQASYMALMFRAQHSNPIPGEHTVVERVNRAGLFGPHIAENAIMMPAQPPAGSPRPDYTYAELAALIVDSWLNSPAHRANLLDPEYTYLGCAARAAHGVLHGDQRVFATQVFFVPFSRNPG